MQDNNKYIDRGWQQMSVLLDKEMPQSPRRRPKVAWWLIATGIILILSGWGYHFYATNQDHKPPVLPETEAVSNGIADNSSLKLSSTTEEKSTTSVQSSESADRAGAETPAESIKSVSIKQPSGQKAIHKSSEGIVDNPIPSEKILPVVENAVAMNNLPSTESTSITTSRKDKTYPVFQSVRAEDVALTFEDDYPLTTVHDMAQTEEEMIVRSGISMVSLESIQPGYLPESARSLPLQTIDATQAGAFGLEALAAAHLNSDGNPFYGIEGGLGTVLRADKRLRLHAGLTYGYYNVDGLGVFGSSKADVEFLGNNGGYPDPSTGVQYNVYDVYSNNLQFSEAKQLTEKFHYLHLPLSVEYRITPRWSASAGVKFAALLSAPARYRLNDARFANVQLSSASRSFLYDYDIVRKFDVAPMLSIGFMVTRDLSVEAGYTHGLVHYINNSTAPDRNDFHRTASVGLRYRVL